MPVIFGGSSLQNASALMFPARFPGKVDSVRMGAPARLHSMHEKRSLDPLPGAGGVNMDGYGRGGVVGESRSRVVRREVWDGYPGPQIDFPVEPVYISRGGNHGRS